MHTNAPCTKCNLENACEGKQMHQYQNATYVNASKCKSMQCHASGEECNGMECNEIVENASECINMHLNAYGKKLHHFWEKTTLIPSWACRPRVAAQVRSEWEGKTLRGWRRTMGAPGAYTCIVPWSKGGGRSPTLAQLVQVTIAHESMSQ